MTTKKSTTKKTATKRISSRSDAAKISAAEKESAVKIIDIDEFEVKCIAEAILDKKLLKQHLHTKADAHNILAALQVQKITKKIVV